MAAGSDPTAPNAQANVSIQNAFGSGDNVLGEILISNRQSEIRKFQLEAAFLTIASPGG